MADRSAEPWYATAAYLYVLHLDSPALAWEYLRRHPDYRHDWLRRRRQPDTAGHWGLRLLEDPALDARDAHPAWFPDHDAVVQLYPDADPPPDALCFDFWRLPGHKHLIHDGKRLVLVAHWPGCCLRFVLAPGLADGMAYAYAIRACAAPCERYAALASELNKIAVAAGAVPAATVRPRPHCWNCTRFRRWTRPWRVRPCGRWPKGCLVWMPLPPTGTPTALCARACDGWCAGAMG